jgi:hypothetical protein
VAKRSSKFWPVFRWLVCGVHWTLWCALDIVNGLLLYVAAAAAKALLCGGWLCCRLPHEPRGPASAALSRPLCFTVSEEASAGVVKRDGHAVALHSVCVGGGGCVALVA